MIKITEWGQLIGHKTLIAHVRRNIELDKLSQTLLLFGPSGLGKSSVAKLVAVDLVSKGDSDKRNKLVKSVILDNKSTESIKLFNMSDMGEREEEIHKVKSELDLGFSTDGVKVVLLDESHNMSKKAQDAILPELEHLPKGVYVILITTDESALRDALVGRLSRYRFNNLNSIELSKLLKQEIRERGLRFQMPEKSIIAVISSYSRGQARDALKLLDEFDNNSTVTNDELSIFMRMDTASTAIQLIRYLYGSMLLGLNFIKDLEIDSTFTDVLVEVLRISLGGQAEILSQDEEKQLRNTLVEEDSSSLAAFVCDVISGGHVSKNKITAAFLRHHKSMVKLPLAESAEASNLKDLSAIRTIERGTKDIKLVRGEEDKSAESFDDFLRSINEVVT